MQPLISHSKMILKRKITGFTLVELITVMIIVGILAAFAAPRFFDTNIFQSRGFADEVKATLRFAQKTAVAQRKFVCVAFTVTAITLTYGSTAACGSDLTSPTGVTPYVIKSPNNDITLSGGANFSFNALGRPSFAAQQNITVTDSAPIVIEVETGYVH
jgi:MSHA pilin protein MshC